MATKDPVKITKEQIKVLNELRKSQGDLNIEQRKTLDALREHLSILTNLDRRQQKIVKQGGVYADLSRQWATNAMSQKKGQQELAGLQKGQMDMFQKALGGQLTSVDIGQQKIDLEEQLSKIGSSYFGQNEEHGKELQEQVKWMITMLNKVEDINVAEQDRNDKADELNKKMGPLRKGWEDIKAKVTDFAKKIFSVKGIITMITGGLIAAGGLLVKHFIGIFKSSMAMQKELGVGAGHAMDLNIATQEAAAGGFMYGESIEDSQARASTLVTEWGVINSETKNSIKAASELERHYGVSTQAAAQLAAIMQSTSSSTKDVLLADMGDEMKSLQKSGVPVGVVMEEIAGDTDFFAKYMKQGGKNIIKAAMFAKKLGMSMSTIAGAAESLLDWETSINAEMEASVLLGREVNMERARELAFAGDLEGMQREIMRQVGSEADFAAMNVVQREALAAAAGLSLTDLAKMVSAQEILNNMTGEELEKHLENQKVTLNIQKLWSGIIGIFQKMYSKFIVPIAEKIKSMLGFTEELGSGFEDTSTILEKIEPKIEALAIWLSDIIVSIIKWGEETWKFIKVLGITEKGVFSVKQMFIGLWNDMKSFLGEQLQILIDKVIIKFGEWWEKVGTIYKLIGAVLVSLWLVPTVLTAINIATKIWIGLQWAFNTAAAANPIGGIYIAIVAIVAIMAGLIYYWDELSAAVANLSGGFFDMWDVLLLILGPIGWIIIAVKKVWENWDLITVAIAASWERTKSLFAGIKEKIADLGGWFAGIGEKIKSVFQGIGDFILNLWKSIVDIIKAPFNFIIKGINLVIGALNSIKIKVPNWIPGIGGNEFGFNIPEIPMLETAPGEGFNIEESGIAQVHAGESVGTFDLKPITDAILATNTRMDKVIALLAKQPTTYETSEWARKQKSVTEQIGKQF